MFESKVGDHIGRRLGSCRQGQADGFPDGAHRRSRKFGPLRTGAAILVLLASTAAVVGCARAADGRFLSNAELKALVADNIRVRVLPLTTAEQRQVREYFYVGGRYARCADRGDSAGTYRIRGDQLCVDNPAAPSCRRLERAGPGRYRETIKYADEPNPRHHEIEVVVTPVRETCVEGVK